MKLTQLNHVYQLSFLPRIFPVNCYLFEEKNELTLIDAGLPSNFKGIVEVVEMLNKPLTNIILTHGHGDHVGALDKLKQHYPDVIVSISERDSLLLKGDTTLNPEEPQSPIKGGVPKNIKTIPDRFLKEGDRVGSLEVFHTPGHTPGSISLYDVNSRAIIAGDALQTRGRIAVCGQMVRRFPFPAFGTWNKEVSLDSVKKIMQLKPTLLAVGHGKMIENPTEEIQQAIKEAEANLAN